MEIQEYQSIIQQTAVYPKEFGAAYTVLGLTGELGELVEALEADVEVQTDEEFEKIFLNINKESGDVYWYITATCNEFGIPLSNVFEGELEADHSTSITNTIGHALLMASKVSELTKKALRDNTVDLDEMTSYLNSIFLHVKDIHNRYGFSLEEVLESNYNKLIKRRETGTLHGSGDHREEEA